MISKTDDEMESLATGFALIALVRRVHRDGIDAGRRTPGAAAHAPSEDYLSDCSAGFAAARDAVLSATSAASWTADRLQAAAGRGFSHVVDARRAAEHQHLRLRGGGGTPAKPHRP